MNSIFDDLYYGNIRPWEKAMAAEGEYGKSVTELTSAERTLLSSLDGEQRSLLEILIKAQSNILEMSCKKYYFDGLRLGIRLMAEAYEGKGKNFTSDES